MLFCSKKRGIFDSHLVMQRHVWSSCFFRDAVLRPRGDISGRFSKTKKRVRASSCLLRPFCFRVCATLIHIVLSQQFITDNLLFLSQSFKASFIFNPRCNFHFPDVRKTIFFSKNNFQTLIRAVSVNEIVASKLKKFQEKLNVFCRRSRRTLKSQHLLIDLEENPLTSMASTIVKYSLGDNTFALNPVNALMNLYSADDNKKNIQYFFFSFFLRKNGEMKGKNNPETNRKAMRVTSLEGFDMGRNYILWPNWFMRYKKVLVIMA